MSQYTSDGGTPVQVLAAIRMVSGSGEHPAGLCSAGGIAVYPEMMSSEYKSPGMPYRLM